MSLRKVIAANAQIHPPRAVRRGEWTLAQLETWAQDKADADAVLRKIAAQRYR